MYVGSGNTTVLKIGIILSLRLESSRETDSQYVSKHDDWFEKSTGYNESGECWGYILDWRSGWSL